MLYAPNTRPFSVGAPESAQANHQVAKSSLVTRDELVPPKDRPKPEEQRVRQSETHTPDVAEMWDNTDVSVATHMQ